MDLLLTRDAFPDHTYGTLEAGTLVLQTIELPWVAAAGFPGGEPTKSCVPVGTYELALHDTMTHPKTWALVNPELGIYHEPADIPGHQVGRTACLIHQGNYASDSEGCVLVGILRGTLNGHPAVLNSQTALLQLKHALPWVTGHHLTIE